jgi:hypothetical protein
VSSHFLALAVTGQAALRFVHIVPPGEVLVITGPEEGAAAGRGHLRAAHADRDQVIDTLKAAFVAGRLTKGEFDARAGRALIARTYADLAVLTADLPAAPPRQPASPGNRPARTPGARNAAIASIASLAAAFLSFCYAAHLDDATTKTLLGLTLFFLLMAFLFAAGAVVELRRRRRRLPPRPGHGGRAPEEQWHSSTGHGPSPLAPRTDQASADMRPHRSRPDRPRGRGVPVPRAASPAPSAA